MDSIPNYRDRSPNDLCLLCKEKKATKKNSHFTPMGMIKSNTGERGKEETYSITPNNEIFVYWGRENIKNTDPEIKPDPHAANFIFCPSCESRLGDIVETPINKVLNQDLRNPNKQDNFPKVKISNDVYYKDCVNEEILRMKLFFYSIVWRQCLQQKLHGVNEEILPPNVEERLRETILSGLYDGVNNNEKIKNCFPFTIVTTEQFLDNTLNIISPSVLRSYPEIFCVNEFLVLFYFNGYDYSKKFPEFFGLPLEVYLEEMVNFSGDNFKITFVEQKVYEEFQKFIYGERAKYWHRINLVDDFKHAFYLRYGGIVGDDYNIIVNDEIKPEIIDAIQKTLFYVPKDNFEGLISNYYAFAQMNVSHPVAGTLAKGYGCILAQQIENAEKPTYAYGIVLAVQIK